MVKTLRIGPMAVPARIGTRKGMNEVLKLPTVLKSSFNAAGLLSWTLLTSSMQRKIHDLFLEINSSACTTGGISRETELTYKSEFNRDGNKMR